MPGLVRGVARTAVVAGTATAVSNRVSRRQANRWAAQEQQRHDRLRPLVELPAAVEAVLPALHPRPLGAPLTGSPGSVISLLFADEGNRLLAGSDTGALLAWDVGLASWIKRVCRLAGRNLTEAEWTQFIPNQPLEETCDPELFSMMESR